ncbi:MAG TPA: hypothetical protein VMW16_04815 [Sedimentisphaerales bacterium]|nr:hypothetical protein [Sedimentisphaerales bacterium]
MGDEKAGISPEQSKRLSVRQVNAAVITAIVLCVMVMPVWSVGSGERKVASGGGRVIHFPSDYSIGRVYLRDSNIPLDMGSAFAGWSRWHEAIGDVRVPAGQVVRLDPYKIAWRGNWALSNLKPDDIQFVTFSWYKDADDSVMKEIGRLTGLEGLYMAYCGNLESGLQHLAGLKKLKFLTLPPLVRTEQFGYLAGLPSLETLCFCGAVTEARLAHIGRLTWLTQLSMAQSNQCDGLEHLKNLKSLRCLVVAVDNPALYNRLAHITGLSELEELSLWYSQMPDEGLVHLSALKKLKKLYLSRATAVTDAGVVHLKDLKSLELLDLPTHAVTDATLEYLVKLDLLKSLHIGNRVTDKGLALIAEMKSLRSLNIDGSEVSPEGMASVGKIKSLTELDVGGRHITDAHIAKLAECDGFKSLALHDCPVTDAGLAHIAKLKSLEKLTIWNMQVSGDGLAFLKELPALEWLELSGVNLGPTGIAHLKGATSLGTAKLRGVIMDVNDNDLAYVAGLTSLRYLYILIDKGSRSSVTDRGLANLSKLKALESLWLNHCEGITDAGLKHLEGLASLTDLNLEDSRITLAGVARLKKKIPEVLVGAPCTADYWRGRTQAILEGRPVREQGDSVEQPKRPRHRASRQRMRR